MALKLQSTFWKPLPDTEARVNLYIGNHGKPDGIEDFVTLITKLMEKRGIGVETSSALVPNAVNLVIDEFTNYIENRRLAALKRDAPSTTVVFVLTEFIERRWGVRSMNHFGGIFDAAAIAVFDIYIKLTRDDFGKITPASVLRCLAYSPLVMLQVLPAIPRFAFKKLLGRRATDPITTYMRKHNRLMYMHMRYLGLKAHLRYADAVMTSHEKIYGQVASECARMGKPLPHLGVLYPELDAREVSEKLMVGKKLFIEITGSITHYRQKWIEHTNHTLIALGLNNVFHWCQALPFSLLNSSRPVERGAYSLHPPQSRTWSYCSPTRIFRALSVDFNLPILTHHFGQNPIEDVCFVLKDRGCVVELYQMYADRMRLKQFIEPRINAYNQLVNARNDSLASKLRTFLAQED